MPKFAESQVTDVLGSTASPGFPDEELPSNLMSIPEELQQTTELLEMASSVPSSHRFDQKRASDASEHLAYIADIFMILKDISTDLQTNLKFTKALYRGTKKSLIGPGLEPKRLHNSFWCEVPSSDAVKSPIKSPGAYSHKSRNSGVDWWQRSMDRHLDFLRGLGDSQRSQGGSTFALASSPGKGAPVSPTIAIASSPDKGASPSLETPVRGNGNSVRVLTSHASDETPSIGHGSETKTRASKATKTSTTTISRILTQHENLQNRWSVQIWRFMEDPNSGRSARLYFYVQLWFLALSVVASCMQVFEDDFESAAGRGASYMHLCVEVVFALELLMRFCICGDRISFVFDGFNIVDFMSICPCGLRIYVLASGESSLEIHAIFGTVPVLRLLKLLRRFETFQLLWSAFLSAAEALPILMFTLFLIVMTFSSAIYYCEPRSSIPSMPLALYFSIVTVTTVGYGDFSPETGFGRLLSCFLAVIGPMYMAIPIGIIGNAFSEVWEDRQRLLMLHKMRTYVKNVGYSEKELRHMFVLIDRDQDGTLDLEEFVAWLDVLEIKMPEHIVAQVFESFDEDDEGSIDFDELLHGLYPRTRHRRRERNSKAL